jgi:hypothetical protein
LVVQPFECRIPRVGTAMIQGIGGDMVLAEQGRVTQFLSASDLLQDHRFGQERIVVDFHSWARLMASGAIDSGYDDSQAPGQDDSKP